MLVGFFIASSIQTYLFTDIFAPEEFIFFALIFILHAVPFLLGSVISIFILPKTFQVIISQVIFCVVSFFYMKNIYFTAKLLEPIFMANAGSVPFVLFIKFVCKAFGIPRNHSAL